MFTNISLSALINAAETLDRRQRNAKPWYGFNEQGSSSRTNWLANSADESISTKRKGRTWLDVYNNTELPSLWDVLSPSGDSSKVRPLTAAAPTASTVKFVLLCALWYSSSALSSNTGKAILIQFRYPVTLTLVQFAFVAAYCLLFCSPWIRFSKLRRPNRHILRSTLPMGVFQVGGHIFSSMAISRIPVSTVHTIKVSQRVFNSIIKRRKFIYFLRLCHLSLLSLPTQYFLESAIQLEPTYPYYP